MIKVSEIKTTIPGSFQTELQQQVYTMLQSLQIPFERVDNEPAVTMEDCLAINDALQVKTSKTLFLCNRQQTNFYLFVTAGDKPFRTKDFGAALGISRVSFAPESFLMPKLGTVIGATTFFSSLLESANDVRVVFDRDVLQDDYYGGTDGTTSCYLRIKTRDLTESIFPYIHREITVIEV